MEDTSSLTFSDETWADDFGRAISEQRARVEQFVSAERERLDKARASLTEQARQIAEEVDQDRAETAQARRQLERRSQEINQQAESLQKLRGELEARQEQWEASHQRAIDHYDEQANEIQRQQAELAERQEEQEHRRVEIDQAQAKLHRDRQAFVLECQEHHAEVDRLATHRGRLEGETVELAGQREQLVADQARTERQRRHIAEGFKEKRAELLKEIKRRRAELSSLDSGQSGEVLRQLEDVARERKQLDEEKESFQAERDQLARHWGELEGRRAEIDESQASLARDRQAFSIGHEEHQADVEHVASLRTQVEERIAELAEEREALATDRARTEGQRRRIAEEFKAKRAALLKESERRRAELSSVDSGQSGEVLRQLDDVARQRKQFDKEVESFQAERDQLARHWGELEGRRVEIDESQTSLARDRQAFSIACEEHKADVEHVVSLRAQVEERVVELTEQREALATVRARTEGQRRRIAQEFRAQRAAALKEIQRGREALDDVQANEANQLHKELQEVAAKRDQSRQECQDLQTQRDGLLERLTESERRLAEALDGAPQIEGEEELAAAKTRAAEAEERAAEAERRAAEAEQRAAEAVEDARGSAADEDLQRRHEMAVDDLRELRALNAELEEQVVRAASAGAQAVASEGVLDWEAQKRRMLASLESDFDEDDEQAAAERLEIEETVRKTDEIVASKDRELEALRQQLEAQASHAADKAAAVDNTAAVEELLDHDAVIAEEREKLRSLQTQWDDKLRQAEIDMSIERAQIGRQRSELEERVRRFEENEENSAHAKPDEESADSSSKSDASPRGRWLSMLGLGDAKKSDPSDRPTS